MSSHSHGCDSCAKVCDEAKAAVKSLQKKVFTLTIVCTSALTLLGEQGAKAVLSTVNSMNTAIAAVDGKAPKDGKETKESTKTSLNNPHFTRPWSPKPAIAKEEHNKFQKDDLVAIAKKKSSSKEKQSDILIPEVTQTVIQNIATSNNQNLTIEAPNVNTLTAADPFSVFLTPSTLPFDVYSTTLALGNNYGFGEYYGYGNLDGNPINIPDAGTVSVFAFGQLINTRKRN